MSSKSGPRTQTFILLGTGLLGAMGGHVVGYMVAHPQIEERAEVLRASGHGYFDIAVSLALVAGMVGLLGQFVLGYLEGRRHPSRNSSGGPRRDWMALAVVQTLVFLTVEVAERALHGTDNLVAMAGEPALWWGLVLQPLFAAIAIFFLAGSRRAGASAGRRGTFASEKQVETNLFVGIDSQANEWIGSGHPSRAPPALSIT